MIKWFKSILDFGTQGSTSQDKHSIRLINLICVFTIIVNFLSGLASLHIVDWNLVIETMSNNICFSIVIFLNYKQKIRAAKWLFITTLLAILVYMPFLVSHSLNGDGLYLVFIASFSAILKDRKPTIILTIMVTILLIAWHVGDHYALIHPINEFKEEETLFMEVNYSIIMVLFLSIVLHSFKKTATDYQNELSQNVLEKEMLLKEVHHRVKNNLQIIISMIGLRYDSASSLEAKESMKDIKARVVSMAIIHNKLYETNGIQQVELNEYFSTLTSLLVDTYKDENQKVEKNISIDLCQIGLEQSIPLGLILTELISNSFKHAFHSQETAQLEIYGEKSENGFYNLTVKDNGDGFEESDIEEGSLGLLLIDMLSNQIQAKIKRVNNNGFETKLALKI